jgi:hypothetical protein
MLNASNSAVAASLLFLFAAAAVPPAHSGERHVVLTNNTRERIIEIYVSDDRTDNWQEDLLGLEFLLPGSSASVDVDDRNGNCRGRRKDRSQQRVKSRLPRRQCLPRRGPRSSNSINRVLVHEAPRRCPSSGR